MSRRRSHGGCPWVVPLVLALLLGCAGTLLYRQYLLTEQANLLSEQASLESQQELTLLEHELAQAQEQAQTQEAKIDALTQEVNALREAEAERERLAAEALAAQPVPLSPEDVKVGDVLEEDRLPEDLTPFFTAREIVEGDEIYERINGKSYRKNPNIALSELRYLTVLHYNFHHKPQVGEVIVNHKIADTMIAIFTELFQHEYEIQSLYLIDNYWTGDGESSDSASIDKNNSSAFCYRTATSSSHLSRHAYGMAIDINPIQNPYLYKSGNRYKWAHDNSTSFVDRSQDDPHIIVEGDICHELFTRYGFTWGGSWKNPIDYQHFQME